MSASIKHVEFTEAQKDFISKCATNAAEKVFKDILIQFRRLLLAFALGIGLLLAAAYFGIIPWARIQQIAREDMLGLYPAYLSDNYDSIRPKVAQTLNDQILTSSPQIKSILKNAVNFTYSGQFRLGTPPTLDSSNQIYFYANPGQSVVAYLSISHLGPDAPQNVIITVDNDVKPVYNLPNELNFNTLDLTTWVSAKESHVAAVSKDDVHFIQFSIDTKGSSKNVVFVNVLINVKGVEL